MDHSCEKCGVAVEDGKPFCPHCRAPQIHVQTPANGIPADITGNSADESLARIPSVDRVRPLTFLPNQLDRGVAGHAALKAGALGTLAALISPLLGVPLAGGLAVFFYRRERGFPPAVGVGARLGGAAGIIPYAITYLISLARVLALHNQQEYTGQLVKLWHALGMNPSDQEIQAGIQLAFSPAGIALSFFFGMIFFVAIAAVAGALVAMAQRETRT